MIMDKSMYSWIDLINWMLKDCTKNINNSKTKGAISLGECVSKLSVLNARATVLSDRERILNQISHDFASKTDNIDSKYVYALNRADNLIRSEALDGIIIALG